MSDSLRADIATTLSRMGVDATAPATTRIARTAHDEPTHLELAALGATQEARAGEPEFVVLSELGRGGMGVVRLALQRSLEREVAIKAPTSAEPWVGEALVREARIMGSLEHPNLVPVHALGTDARGQPILVMKRVEGVSWRELLEADDHPVWEALLVGHRDKLRAHVEILSQVCRAVAFAHARGVIHRDIKPDNVMIGGFGEVYLLDWGVALRLSERATEPLGLVGTPAYVSPEMAQGDASKLDERTDVYLLGATLYEVLTGRAPNDAPTAVMAIVSALSGREPPLPDDLDQELASILRGSMAFEKTSRLSSAEEMRTSLARFLVSRDAEIAASAARAALGEAVQAMAEEGPGSARAHRSLIEARFGLQAAHKMRPHDTDLRAELDSAITLLVEREIANRSPAGARVLLDELASVPEGLARSVEQLESDVTDERRAAAELARARLAADTSNLSGPLSLVTAVVLLVGFGFGGWNVWAAADGPGYPVWRAVLVDVVVLLTGFAMSWLKRRVLFATPASRTVTITYLTLGVGIVGSDVISFTLGQNTDEAVPHSLFVAAVITAVVAATMIREIWWCVPLLLTCIAVVIADLRLAPIMALVALGGCAAVFVRAFRLLAKGRVAESPESGGG